MNDKDAPLRYANGHGVMGPWIAKTTTTKVTTTTTETHFFPLFRRRQNNARSQAPGRDRADAGRDKALPAPPVELQQPPGEPIGVGAPPTHVSSDRDITPRAQPRVRDVTPTSPMPITSPATPRPKHKPPHDIRRVRSSGTLRESHPDPSRRSEYTERAGNALLGERSLPPSLSASPSRGRQTAISSPSLSASGRTLSPPVLGPSAFSPGTRQTVIYTSNSSWGTGAPQGWGSRLEREQGRLTRESQHEFGHIGAPSTSYSLGSRDQHQERERERSRRPSAPSLSVSTSGSTKGKGKAGGSVPAPKDAGGKRSLLSRRPSFWSLKGKPKMQEPVASSRSSQPTLTPDVVGSNSNMDTKQSLDVPKAGPSRSSTSFEEPLSPRLSAYSSRPSTNSRSSIDKVNSRPSMDKLSALHRSHNNSRQNLSNPRPSTDSARQSMESRPSLDMALPNVRPASPLFSEFGVYRASVDFAAAGGPRLMAALAERGGLTERGRGEENVIMEGVESGASRPLESSFEHQNGNTEPISIPGAQTPPRRRQTNNSSAGRATSWRRSLVESARNFMGGSGASVEGVDSAPTTSMFGDHVLSGSPVRTASSSPVPWAITTTSPRGGQGSGSRAEQGSPAPTPGTASPALGSGSPAPGSPAPGITTGSLRSRYGSPVRAQATSPTGTRVTFGDELRRPRTGSITAGIASVANWRVGGGDGDGSGNRTGIRRARSTSRLTAALSPTRSRSFSLFGPRPGSAGQAQTQAQASREREMKGSAAPSVSALGYTHPSAFGPATDPGLTLSPPMLGGRTAVGYLVTSPSPVHAEISMPGTPMTGPVTPLTGSQLSLGGGAWSASGYGGSSVGHGGSINGTQFGSSNTNVSGTTTAGASRTSSILLRSPLRPRSSTNPPLLRRLSGVFGSGSGVGMFAGKSVSEISGEVGGAAGIGLSLGTSIGASSGKPGPSSKAPVVAKAEGDTPEVFLARLLESVSKTEIANAIALRNDSFHAAALALYMDRFNFVLDPLDIALRRLLMDLCLPKETQQIDRVMEAFAKRYADCNPGLFVSEDHAYILAFSLMMLHTDAFNKSNKNKMTKADYVKNTRMPGIPPEILDCFFDNIVFAPFIFIEDVTDVNGQRGFVHESVISKGSISGPMSNPNNSGTLLASKPKIDPYYIITQNLLDPLRVPVDKYIPPVSPFSFTGTTGSLDAAQLRRVFVSNSQLEIAGTGSESVRIGVNKLGLLSRKDDLLEGGRRAASRKWRRWAVVLTGSQLLFFRETAWPLLAPIGVDSQPPTEAGSQTRSLRPEEVVSLKDAIALYDVSYAKYSHVFRFIMPTGRQQLMQAANEQDMNEWIARINYASALKSAGVRVRELAMNVEESRATGVAAAVSHVRDQRRGKVSTPPSTAPSPSGGDIDSLEPLSNSPKASENRSNMSSEVELDATIEPSDGGMKDTFDEIKAHLAATHNTFPRTGLAPPKQTGYRATSLGGSPQRPSSSLGITEDGVRTRMTTRAEVVISKVKDLESKVNATQLQLQNELRIARNFAVLAPFQQTTRTRIRLAVEALARRVQMVRMDVAKMACHRDVLAADLVAEEEEREQLRTIALEAANEQLLLSVPRMTLSVHYDVPEETERRPSPAGSDTSASPAWSFRSATDYPDPTDDPTLVASKRDTSLTTPEAEAEQLSPSLPRKSEASLQPRPSFAASSRSGLSQVSSNGDVNGQSAEQASGSGHGTVVTEEEAEEQAEVWHATRAGRRVSLVELPQPSDGRKLVELIRQRTHSSRVMGEVSAKEADS